MLLLHLLVNIVATFMGKHIGIVTLSKHEYILPSECSTRINWLRIFYVFNTTTSHIISSLYELGIAVTLFNYIQSLIHAAIIKETLFLGVKEYTRHVHTIIILYNHIQSKIL